MHLHIIQKFNVKTILTFSQGMKAVIRLVSISKVGQSYVIYSSAVVCYTCLVLSLVSVLGSEEDCPLVECLVLLEPRSRMNSLTLFSSSGQNLFHYILK